MTTTEPHPALGHRCPFCHADPGQACRTHRGRGHELGHPHSRQIMLSRPDLQAVVAAAKVPAPALCCECGNLRTVSTDYHFGIDDENRGNGLFMDPRGWIETGTLKCSHCGTRTRHALLNKEGKRDYAEDYQRYVLGGDWDSRWAPDREQLRERYFAQFPRNPFVQHKWWKSAEDQARKDGKQWFPSMCGELVELPDSPRGGATISEGLAPTQITDPDRAEHENLDVETGLWWTADGWCVNCLRVRHDWLLKENRTQLLTQLIEVSAAVATMSAEDVTALREHLDRIMADA